MALREIHLHGKLASEYGKLFKLDVTSPTQALRALSIQLPGFEDMLKEGAYRIVRGDLDSGLPLKADELDIGLGKKELHIIPTPMGAGLEVIVIVGLTLVAAVGLSLALMPTIEAPNPNSRETSDRQNSGVFDGPVNVTEQGHPVPLVFGTMRVGSVVGAASIDTSDDQPNYVTNPGGGSGYGGSYGTGGFFGDDGSPYTQLKKGGKGGGSKRAAEEVPNSLQSTATARIIDIVSEGEIEGLVNGLKSVYLDDTPVQNDDDTFNFQGFALDERVGLPDQPPVLGFSSVESSSAVGTEITIASGPVEQTVTTSTIDRIRVTLGVQAFYEQDTENGDIRDTAATVAIDLKEDGGFFAEVGQVTFDGKTNDQYQRSFTFTATEAGNGAPWTVRARRITPDSASSALQNATYFDIITELTDVKLTYPDTAYFALTVDAKQFGSQIPTRSYLIKGIKLLVPTNYNPVTRVYTGVWDGTFKTAWTDNPAWVFYNLLVNKRWGLGNRVQAANVDKYGLYAIGQYCDALVSDGRGGTEPRFACNAVVNTRRDALDLLTALASSFRSMIYWSAGAVTLSQDAPTTVSRIVNPSNVKDGVFDYQNGASYESKFSAVLVSWNDPNESYRLNTEVVEDPALVEALGWRPVEITAFGCTSQSMAHRVGLWALEDQETADNVVQYIAGFDHADLEPGRVVATSDPRYTSTFMGGRVASGAMTSSVPLDREVTLEVGETYTLMVMQSDGTVAERTVSTGAGDATALTVSSAFAEVAPAGAVWALKSTSVAPREWRLRTSRELEDGEFQMTGVLHDATKYARVEDGVYLEALTFTNLPTGPLTPPQAIGTREFYRQEGDSTIPSVVVSVRPPLNDGRVTAFQIQHKRPNTDTWESLGTGSDITREVVNVAPGDHDFRARSVDNAGRFSGWVGGTVTIVAETAALPEVTGLSKVKSDEALNALLRWTKPTDTRPIRYEILFNTTNDFGGATSLGVQLDTEFVVTRVGYYWVRTAYMGQRSPSPVATQIATADLPEVRARSIIVKSQRDATNADPTFEENDLWITGDHLDYLIGSSAGHVLASVVDGLVSPRVIRSSAYTRVDQVDRFAIDPGENYNLEVVARRLTGDQFIWGIWRFYNSDGNLISTTDDPTAEAAWDAWTGADVTGDAEIAASAANTNWYFPAALGPAGTGWKECRVILGPDGDIPIPEGAVEIELGLMTNHNGAGTVGTQEINLMKISRAVDARKIVAETIEGRHIKAETFTGREMSLSTTFRVGENDNNSFTISGDPSVGYVAWAGADAPSDAPWSVTPGGRQRFTAWELIGADGALVMSSDDIATDFLITKLIAKTGGRTRSLSDALESDTDYYKVNVDQELSNIRFGGRFRIAGLSRVDTAIPATMTLELWHTTTDPETGGFDWSVDGTKVSEQAFTKVSAPTAPGEHQFQQQSLTFGGPVEGLEDPFNLGGTERTIYYAIQAGVGADAKDNADDLYHEHVFTTLAVGDHWFRVVVTNTWDAQKQGRTLELETLNPTSAGFAIGSTTSGGAEGSPGSYLGMSDTPNSYTNQQRHVPAVNDVSTPTSQVFRTISEITRVLVPEDFGIKSGNSSADNFAAFEALVARLQDSGDELYQAAGTKAAIYLGPVTYTFSKQLGLPNSIYLQGAGINSTTLSFDGSGGSVGIKNVPTGVTGYHSGACGADFSIATTADIAGSKAVHVEWPDDQQTLPEIAFTNEAHCHWDRVNVYGIGLGNFFETGFCFKNVSYFTLHDSRYIGSNAEPDGGYPAYLKGTGAKIETQNTSDTVVYGQSIESVIQHFNVSDCDTAVDVSGFVEGLYILNPSFVRVRYGVKAIAKPDTTQPSLYIMDGHINATYKGIYADGYSKSFIRGVTVSEIPDAAFDGTEWVGIDIANTRTNKNLTEEWQIDGVMIYAENTRSGKTGDTIPLRFDGKDSIIDDVHVVGAANGTFRNLTKTVELGANSSGVTLGRVKATNGIDEVVPEDNGTGNTVEYYEPVSKAKNAAVGGMYAYEPATDQAAGNWKTGVLERDFAIIDPEGQIRAAFYNNGDTVLLDGAGQGRVFITEGGSLTLNDQNQATRVSINTDATVTVTATMTVDGLVAGARGDASSPWLRYSGQTTDGIYWRNSSGLGLTVGGTAHFEVVGGNTFAKGGVWNIDDNDTGIRFNGEARIDILIGNSQRAQFTATLTSFVNQPIFLGRQNGFGGEVQLQGPTGGDRTFYQRHALDGQFVLFSYDVSEASFENHIIAGRNGGVELYYDNVAHFATTSGGGTLTGDLDITARLIVGGMSLPGNCAATFKHITNGYSDFTPATSSAYRTLIVKGNNNGYAGITVASTNTVGGKAGALVFADEDAGFAGGLVYTHAADAMSFYTAGASRGYLSSTGSLYLLTALAATTTQVFVANGDATGAAQLFAKGGSYYVQNVAFASGSAYMQSNANIAFYMGTVGAAAIYVRHNSVTKLTINNDSFKLTMTGGDVLDTDANRVILKYQGTSIAQTTADALRLFRVGSAGGKAYFQGATGYNDWDLYANVGASQFVLRNASTGHVHMLAIGGDGTWLYHANVLRLATTSGGIQVASTVGGLSDTDTFVNFSGSNEIRMVLGGSTVYNMNSSYLYTAGGLYTRWGSSNGIQINAAASTGIHDTTDTNTGIKWNGLDILTVFAGGVNIAAFGTIGLTIAGANGQVFVGEFSTTHAGILDYAGNYLLVSGNSGGDAGTYIGSRSGGNINIAPEQTTIATFHSNGLNLAAGRYLLADYLWAASDNDTGWNMATTAIIRGVIGNVAMFEVNATAVVAKKYGLIGGRIEWEDESAGNFAAYVDNRVWHLLSPTFNRIGITLADATGGVSLYYNNSLKVFTAGYGLNVTGLLVGSPSGGNPAAGEVRAQAVYDDGVLLSCYVFEQATQGHVDIQKWDAKVPDRYHEADHRWEERSHDPARKFLSRIGTKYDPLDIDGYALHWKEKGHLPSMPNEDKYVPTDPMATGTWIQRLIEDAEIKAVHIENLNRRVKNLESQLVALS